MIELLLAILYIMGIYFLPIMMLLRWNNEKVN